MDIVELIRNIRESKFDAQTSLKPHQLALIPSFEEYQVVEVKKPKKNKSKGILPDDM